MQIWINEIIDPCDIIHSCIACCNEDQAQACHAEFQSKLTDEQKSDGWVAQMRIVESWDDVPVTALKLS